MTAADAFRAGRLAEAADLQLAAVKAHPADDGRRVFLFELAAFAGDWERARRQLDALGADDPTREVAVAQYRGLLDAEAARRRFVADGTPPVLLGDPSPDRAARLEAARLLRDGNTAAAAAALAAANAALPPVAGLVNGTPFDRLRDADDLFAGVLEVYAQGKYVWVGLDQVESIATHPPKYPRDLIWLPARLTARGGESGEVFLPVLYPGTAAHPDDAVRLGRATDWAEPAPGLARGAGLRTYFYGDDGETRPTDWRELVVTS